MLFASRRGRSGPERNDTLESDASFAAGGATMRVRMVTVTEGMDRGDGREFPGWLNHSRGLYAGLTGA